MSDHLFLKDVEGLHGFAVKACVEPKPIKINQVINKITREIEFTHAAKFLLERMKDTESQISKPEKDSKK